MRVSKSKAAPGAELRQVREGAEIGLLEHVLRLGVVIENGVRDSV